VKVVTGAGHHQQPQVVGVLKRLVDQSRLKQRIGGAGHEQRGHGQSPVTEAAPNDWEQFVIGELVHQSFAGVRPSRLTDSGSELVNGET